MLERRRDPLWGVPRDALRALRHQLRPKSVRRADRGKPRKLPAAEMERYCEIVAALKIRTSNKKGRHLSTVRAIELLEEHGVETPEGLVRLPRDAEADAPSTATCGNGDTTTPA